MSVELAWVLGLSFTPLSVGLAIRVANSREPFVVIQPGLKLRLLVAILLFLAGLSTGVGIGVLL